VENATIIMVVFGDKQALKKIPSINVGHKGV
jgi:hypothetical protein